MSNMQRAQRDLPADVRWEESTTYRVNLPELNLHQAKQDLAQAQKSRLMGSNSAKYRAVSDGIQSVIDALSTAFSDANAGPAKVIKSYSELLQACKVYNSKSIDANGNAVARRAHFEKGRRRQDLVSRIEEMAKKDFAQLQIYFDKMPSLPPQDRAKNTQQALQKARTSDFKLKGTWTGQKHIGGAISDLAIINEGDFEGTNASGLFKREELYKVQSKQRTALEKAAMLRGKIKIDNEDYDYIENYIKSQGSTASVVGCVSALQRDARYNARPRIYQVFVDTLYNMCSGADTMRDYMNTNIETDVREEGGSVNLSKLNVASARIAKLLGQGHLIAGAELATMTDSNNQKISGILMEKAEGREGMSFLNEEREKEYANNLNNNNPEKKLEAIEKMITPQFQKSLADLQVLDNIFGQVDRHAGNYFVQQDNQGKLTGVTGIDNDFAFGQLKLGAKGAPKNQFLQFAVNAESQLTIPHMSDSLATAIQQLTLNQLKYALADVLTDAQISGVWYRVQQLKQAIEAERENKDSKRILKDDEWNDDTLNDFKQNTNSYLGTLLSDAQSKEYAGDRHNLILMKQTQEIVWKRIVDGGELQTVEKAHAFFANLCDKSEYAKMEHSGVIEDYVLHNTDDLKEVFLPMLCKQKSQFASVMATGKKFATLYPNYAKDLPYPLLT